MAFLHWEQLNTERRAGLGIQGATTEDAALVQYVGQTNANGHGGFGFMRPLEGAQVRGDLSRGRAAIRANPAGSRTSTINIGSLTVQTKATDAMGLARDLPTALQRAVPQANVGMQ